MKKFFLKIIIGCLSLIPMQGLLAQPHPFLNEQDFPPVTAEEKDKSIADSTLRPKKQSFMVSFLKRYKTLIATGGALTAATLLYLQLHPRRSQNIRSETPTPVPFSNNVTQDEPSSAIPSLSTPLSNTHQQAAPGTRHQHVTLQTAHIPNLNSQTHHPKTTFNQPHRPTPSHYHQHVPKNIQDIVQRYSKSTALDGKIFTTTASETATLINSQTDTPLSWETHFEGTPLLAYQFPALYQSEDFNDTTNYCGFYSYYNAWLLKECTTHDVTTLFEELRKKGLLDRNMFITFFQEALIFINNHRAKKDATGHLTEFDIQNISLLSHEELIFLETGLKKGVKSLNLDDENECHELFIGALVKNFIDRFKSQLNESRHVYIANSAKTKGSHLLAIGLEKVNGRVIITLLDSLGHNRKEDLTRWLTAKDQQRTEIPEKDDLENEGKGNEEANYHTSQDHGDWDSGEAATWEED